MLLRGIESGAIKRIWPVGVLSPSFSDRGQIIRNLPVLGGIDDVEDIIADFAKRNKPIARLVMTPSAFEPEAHPESVLMRARKLGVIVSRMSPDSLKRGIATARRAGLKPVAVIPVDLFGQPADHDAIAEIARAEGLFVLDDAAQGFGASYKGRKLGTFGLATATSFFPAKPLGCFGDGGAIFTDDDELAATLRSIRVHGQGVDKYDNVRLGLTGRLDTMPAPSSAIAIKV